MLDKAETEGFDHIICWEPNGKGFRIKDPALLENKILPRFFKQTKYRSFLRQLQLYSFFRTFRGPKRGLCYHKLFRRDAVDLLSEIKRSKRQAPEIPNHTISFDLASDEEKQDNRVKADLDIQAMLVSPIEDDCMGVDEDFFSGSSTSLQSQTSSLTERDSYETSNTALASSDEGPIPDIFLSTTAESDELDQEDEVVVVFEDQQFYCVY